MVQPCSLQRAHDLGAGDPGRQDHRGADRERRQQPDGERIGVMQRQRQQDPIVGPGQARRLERPQIRADIAVAERHALGRARGARGVEQHRQLVGAQLGQIVALVAQQRAPRAHAIRARARTEPHRRAEPDRGYASRGPVRRANGAVVKSVRAPLCSITPLELLVAHLLAERHGERAAAHDREQRDDPFRLARREQADHVARAHAALCEPGREAPGHRAAAARATRSRTSAAMSAGASESRSSPSIRSARVCNTIAPAFQDATAQSPSCLAKDGGAHHR